MKWQMQTRWLGLAVAVTMADCAFGSIVQTQVKGSDLQSQLANLHEKVFEKPPEANRGSFSIGGEFLYWKAYDVGVIAAVTEKITPLFIPQFSFTLGIPNDEKALYSQYGFEPGFRVDAGYQFACDLWDLNFIWTHLKWGKTQKLNATDEIFIAEIWDESGILASVPNLSDKSHLLLNILDLELGKSIFFSSRFAFRPFIGLRGLFMDAHNTINSSQVVYGVGGTVVGSGDSKIKLTNDGKGVGLRTGFDLEFSFGKGWGLYGLGSFSLLWQKLDLIFQQRNTGFLDDDLLDLKISHRDRPQVVKSAFQVKAGLDWQTSFSQDRYHFIADIGYEFNIFINQFELKRLISPGNMGSQLTPTSVDDIAFQGLTLGARFHF